MVHTGIMEFVKLLIHDLKNPFIAKKDYVKACRVLSQTTLHIVSKIYQISVDQYMFNMLHIVQLNFMLFL